MLVTSKSKHLQLYSFLIMNYGFWFELFPFTDHDTRVDFEGNYYTLVWHRELPHVEDSFVTLAGPEEPKDQAVLSADEIPF